MMLRARLAQPRLALDAASGAVVTAALAPETGALVVVLEQEIYRPGAAPGAQGGWLSRPRLAPRPLDLPTESTDTLRASNLGYRTEAGVAYPPTLDRPLVIDRELALHPARPAAAASWGTLRLANLGRQYDATAISRNSDGRPMRVLLGRRRRDEARGLDLDPAYAALTPLMTGVARPWTLAEGALSIPVRDASYLLERPLQETVYAGTGGLEGGADLKGRRKPRARGGNYVFPIRDVAPVWVDRAEGILQVSDAGGAVLAVAEAGDTGHLVGLGQVADLGAAWPPAVPMGGRWRWMTQPDGLFLQLESPTSAQITADVVGFFPSGAHASTAAEIARRLMIEDLSLPPAMLDQDSLFGLDAAYPWIAGDYWDGSGAVSGDAAVGLLLASLGCKLVPARSGRLRAWAMRALPIGTRPAATYTTAELVAVAPSTRLAQEGLSPPPYRWRVGWGRNNTVQTGDLDPDVSGDRLDFVSNEYRHATWLDTGLLAAWRNPTDPDPVPTRLLQEADATALADALGAQWGVAPRLYDCTLPLHLGLRHEIGDPLVIAYPLDDLDQGRIGQVVGEQTDLRSATSVLTVLI
jgi:hypothetical protein